MLQCTPSAKFFNTMFTCSCLPFIKTPDRVTGRSKTLIDKDVNSGGQISFKAPDFSCASDRAHKKNGCSKPHCAFNQDTNKSIAFCSLLPK